MNSARTLGYMSSGDCPANWIVCPPCDGLVDASGDAPYTMANITEAPWYDVEDEATHRFYGVHALSMEGLNDSTRTAEISEGILDGGVVGRVRHAVRQVRVRALLSGNGEDALEAGLGWLKAALDPDTCGTHGNSCGAVDSCFYTACPPERSTFDSGTWVENPPLEDWAVVHTNLATNPSFEAPGGTLETVRTNLYIHPGAGQVWTNVNGTQTPLADGTQFDINVERGVGDWVVLSGENISGTVGQPFIAEIEVEVPVGYPALSLFYQMEMNPAHLNGDPVTINPGEKKRVGLNPGMVWGENAGHRLALRVGTFNVPVGARFIVRKMLAEYASVARPYFDGSTLNTGDWTYAWTGATNNSTSIQMGRRAPTFTGGVNAQPVVSTAWASTGTHSMLVLPTSVSNPDSFADWLSDGELRALLKPSTTYTLMATVRLAAAQTGTLHTEARGVFAHLNGQKVVDHDTPGTQAPNTPGIHPLRVTFTTPASLAGYNTIRLYNGALLGGGDVWWDDFMLVEGAYTGPYFDGSTPDTADDRYAWTGTADASTSTHEIVSLIPQPPTFVPDYEDPEGAWQEAVDDLVRSLHNVTCISGPLIEQKLHSRSLWGYVVEFTLAAGTPWLFGLTKPVVIPPSLPVIVQDVPYNLMPHPSAELSSGTVIVATNLSQNPSVEVDAATWNPWYAVITGASPAPFLTSGRSTELAAGGSSASFLHRLLGNNGATAVTNAESRIASTNVVQLGAYSPGTRFSFSIWGAALVVAGGSGSQILELSGYAEWRNAADANIGAVVLGTTTDPADFGGKVFSAKSQAPPAGATSVHIYVIARVRWSSSATAANNSDIRVYADTVAVTIP